MVYENPMTTIITVHTPFRLTLTDGTAPIPFAVGEHEVEDEIARHWYVRAHTEPIAEATAEALTPAVADAPAEGAGNVHAIDAPPAPSKKKK